MTTLPGLGTMGLGIAQAYAAADFDVRVTDAVPAARDAALPRFQAGTLTEGAMEALLGRITVVPDPEVTGPLAAMA